MYRWEKELARDHPNANILVENLRRRTQKLESDLAHSIRMPADSNLSALQNHIRTQKAQFEQLKDNLYSAKSKLRAIHIVRVKSIVDQIHESLGKVKVVGDGQASDVVSMEEK
ncbi:hypothetical protein G6011_04569 [Alternaria panax]|uniref:Uncharacterized protein n=1 Tax=Alternaria panax TaxID=48097 RepID=A0AAD4IHC1_9PLEO|nr:hypothetical protein G6011_04569 [Alternaria panax]